MNVVHVIVEGEKRKLFIDYFTFERYAGSFILSEEGFHWWEDIAERLENIDKEKISFERWIEIWNENDLEQVVNLLEGETKK